MKRRFRLTRLKLALLGVLAVLVFGAASCTSGGANGVNQRQANTQLNIYNNTQPPPQFTKSQIRQTAIEVETAQAEGVLSTTFFFHMGLPDPYSICPSIGFPISATDQITNPQQLARTGGNNSVEGVVSQIDPNGIYSGTTGSGTYVLCLNTQGQTYAVYAEGDVTTMTGAVSWDYQNHRMTNLTNPTGSFSQLSQGQVHAPAPTATTTVP